MTTTGGEPKYSARGGWATTARVVRHDHAAMTDVVVTKLEPTPPPVLANPPRPHGDLSTAGAAEIITIAEPIWATSKTVRTSLRGGIKDLLAELEKARGTPGSSGGKRSASTMARWCRPTWAMGRRNVAG